jgi:hypothetical protein
MKVTMVASFDRTVTHYEDPSAAMPNQEKNGYHHRAREEHKENMFKIRRPLFYPILVTFANSVVKLIALDKPSANELSLEKFPKRLVNFSLFLTQVNIGHEQLVLLEYLAVFRFDVVANRHSTVLVHDFLAFL